MLHICRGPLLDLDRSKATLSPLAKSPSTGRLLTHIGEIRECRRSPKGLVSEWSRSGSPSPTPSFRRRDGDKLLSTALGSSRLEASSSICSGFDTRTGSSQMGSDLWSPAGDLSSSHATPSSSANLGSSSTVSPPSAVSSFSLQQLTSEGAGGSLLGGGGDFLAALTVVAPSPGTWDQHPLGRAKGGQVPASVAAAASTVDSLDPRVPQAAAALDRQGSNPAANLQGICESEPFTALLRGLIISL